jgi:hypothetical protein
VTLAAARDAFRARRTHRAALAYHVAAMAALDRHEIAYPEFDAAMRETCPALHIRRD